MRAAFLMPDTWTKMYDLVLNEAEILEDAGRTDLVEKILSWTLPVLRAASGSAELAGREAELRIRTGIIADSSLEKMAQAAVLELDELH